VRNTARGSSNANFSMPSATRSGVILTSGPGSSSAAWANFEF
jgi:hypothetical protein